jgi:toluene monooxygenase system ferredoxin subunit
MAWKRVCSVDGMVPNELRKIAVDGVDVVVVNIGDGFRVIPPMCPHMEEPLAESGLYQDGVFTCTKHLWQWDLKTGARTGEAERDIKMYQTRLDGSDLYAFIDKPLTYDYEEEG